MNAAGSSRERILRRLKTIEGSFRKLSPRVLARSGCDTVLLAMNRSVSHSHSSSASFSFLSLLFLLFRKIQFSRSFFLLFFLQNR